MPSQIIRRPPIQQKSFIGDFLGAVITPALTLAGSAIGGPIGGVLGGGLGSGLKGPLSKFKKGGQVVKPKKMKKGSKEAKLFMANLRAMRKK